MYARARAHATVCMVCECVRVCQMCENDVRDVFNLRPCYLYVVLFSPKTKPWHTDTSLMAMVQLSGCGTMTGVSTTLTIHSLTL